MHNALLTMVLAVHLILPGIAAAQDVVKSPLSYSLREYGVILGIALLGGFARWYTAVRRGDLGMLSFPTLVGELSVSAFAGLLTFWACESAGLSPLITAAAAGVAGHAGGSGISWMERLAKRHVARRLGVPETGQASLGDQ